MSCPLLRIDDFMFRAHAKILLFGEYLMLDGYLGLAIPLRHGQTLTVEPRKKKGIQVHGYTVDGLVWQDEVWPSTQSSLFHKSLTWLATQWYLPSGDWTLTTQLSYPQHWWLGSSSTFLDLLAQWTGCDPFALYRAVSLWSGYDIACARQKKPLLYDPLTMDSQAVDLESSLLASMYCVPCGQKQSSDKAIAQYRARSHQGPDQYDRCEFLDGLLYEQTVWWWIQGMTYHDEVIVSLIDQPALMTTQPRIGEIGYGKWLGAWWWDCFLILSDQGYEDVRAACHAAWYDTCIPLQMMMRGDDHEYASGL